MRIVHETKITRTQSISDNDVVLNTPWRNGVYKTANCNKNDIAIAIIKNLFEKPFSDLQLNTLNIWYITNTVNATEVALRAPTPLISS